MAETCRSVVLTGPEKIEMRSFPIPGIGDDDGLLKVELVGVCGSDPAIYEGRPTRGPRPFPLIPGHEIVGRVVKMGESARRRHGVTEGDRVVVEYAFGCGACDPCVAGRYTLCERAFTYGSMISCQDPPHLFGGYGEYVYLHPRAMVHRVGDGISPELGVMICAVLGNAVRWLRQVGGVSLGDTVAVVGPGQQGLAAVAVARECGASTVAAVGIGRDRGRLAMARRFGADLAVNAEAADPRTTLLEANGGRLADVAIDVSGSPAGAETALSLVAKGGTLVLPGMYKGKRVSLPLDYAVMNEVRMVGVFSHDFRSVRPAIRMAERHRYPFEELVTHRFPLERAEEAIHLVAGRRGGELPLKVVLDPWAPAEGGAP